MKTIFKYPLPAAGEKIRMPKGAQLLSCQWQPSAAAPFIWALHDDPNDPDLVIGYEYVQILVFGTGHSVYPDPGLVHLGTIQELGGSLIWHVFEARPREQES